MRANIAIYGNSEGCYSGLHVLYPSVLMQCYMVIVQFVSFEAVLCPGARSVTKRCSASLKRLVT